MRLPPAEAENDWLNLTPLLDVVLNLLLFFLIATHFHQQERDLEVSVPEVGAAQPLTSTPELIVNVTQDGRYKVVEQEFTESQLATLIRDHATKNPHQPVLVRGDGRSALRYSARVMALCNRENIDCRLAAVEE
jgi:biopolymer transport protein ExbD